MLAWFAQEGILLSKHCLYARQPVKHAVPRHLVYVAATLVDDVSSGAVRSMSEHPGVSVHMSMNYFSPTPGGQDCEVDSRVTKAGRTLAFAEVHPFVLCSMRSAMAHLTAD